MGACSSDFSAPIMEVTPPEASTVACTPPLVWMLQEAISLHGNLAFGVLAGPGAVRFNLDNIAVGCMIAPTTVRADFNTAVTCSGANDGV